MIGHLLGLVARLWLATLRVRLDVHPALATDEARSVSWVLAFFHGTQFPLLAWRRRRRTAVIVSLSKDGEMQARALAVLGFEIFRGSSSRSGARGLAALVRALAGGHRDAAFAVDGPRGPYGVVKPGAVFVAARTGGWLVPMGSAIGPGKVFRRAWDRFALPLPFSTVGIVLGAPLPPGDPAKSGREALAEAISEANARAAALLAAPRPGMVPSRLVRRV